MRIKEIFNKRNNQIVEIEGERIRKQNKERFWDVTNDLVLELKLNRRALRDYEII